MEGFYNGWICTSLVFNKGWICTNVALWSAPIFPHRSTANTHSSTRIWNEKVKIPNSDESLKSYNEYKIKCSTNSNPGWTWGGIRCLVGEIIPAAPYLNHRVKVSHVALAMYWWSPKMFIDTFLTSWVKKTPH